MATSAVGSFNTTSSNTIIAAATAAASGCDWAASTQRKNEKDAKVLIDPQQRKWNLSPLTNGKKRATKPPEKKEREMRKDAKNKIRCCEIAWFISHPASLRPIRLPSLFFWLSRYCPTLSLYSTHLACLRVSVPLMMTEHLIFDGTRLD